MISLFKILYQFFLYLTVNDIRLHSNDVVLTSYRFIQPPCAHALTSKQMITSTKELPKKTQAPWFLILIISDFYNQSPVGQIQQYEYLQFKEGAVASVDWSDGSVMPMNLNEVYLSTNGEIKFN